MQPLGEAVLDWCRGGEEDAIVLPSFEDGIWKVLWLIAFASCMENGIAIKAIIWVMNSIEAKPTPIKIKTETIIWKWLCKSYKNKIP